MENKYVFSTLYNLKVSRTAMMKIHNSQIHLCDTDHTRKNTTTMNDRYKLVHKYKL